MRLALVYYYHSFAMKTLSIIVLSVLAYLGPLGLSMHEKNLFYPYYCDDSSSLVNISP